MRIVSPQAQIQLTVIYANLLWTTFSSAASMNLLSNVHQRSHKIEKNWPNKMAKVAKLTGKKVNINCLACKTFFKESFEILISSSDTSQPNL